MVTPIADESSLLKTKQKSVWIESLSLNNIRENSSKTTQNNSRQSSPISSDNSTINRSDDIKEIKTQTRFRCWPISNSCSYCLQGCILGSLIAGIGLGIVIGLWLTSKTTTTYSTMAITTNPTSSTTNLITTSTTVSTVSTSTKTTTTTTATTTTTTATTTTTTATTTTTTATTTTTTATTTTTTATTTTTTATTTTTTATTTTTTATTTTTTATTTSTTAATCPYWLWNTTGVTVAGNGIAGSASNQLNSPWNIFIDTSTNILYIADSQNHRIQKWLPGASNGITVAGTGTSGSTATLLNTPRDVYVDSSQNIYVADSSNNRIQFFPNGSTTGITVSSNWPAHGSFWGVQVVSQSVYACDNTQSAVWNNGTAVAGNQGTGAGNNQLNQPQGFAVDTSVSVGTTYIVNSQQQTIVQWTVGSSTGVVVAGVNGNQGSTPTLLKYPVAVKLDSYTNMFVVDNNNHRIQLFCRYPTVNTTGRTIAGTGISGSASNTLTYPAGIALDSSLNLYVSDTSNNRVQKFQRLI